MSKALVTPHMQILLCLMLFGTAFCAASQQPHNTDLDKTKYISIDEIKPGMEAYCLTTYKDTKIEKFPLDVLSVARNVRPARDMILVQGTDDRFIHTGPVAGCSGSPVYIEGRLAGALAYAWFFSKDPLYGVTPIEEMLEVGKAASAGHKTLPGPAFGFDFSRPLDFEQIYEKVLNYPVQNYSPAGMTALPCPLITSGLPAQAVEKLDESLRPFGFFAVSAIAAAPNTKHANDAKLLPGASLVVPLVRGDIRIEAVGTATEIVGDEVYAFGHSFLGYGPIDLPMATGQVHTVVSSQMRSFKLATSLEVVGALRTDEAAAVRGKIGDDATMIPLTINIDRYNDPNKREYNCLVADNRLLTPAMLRSALIGAALMFGSLPPDHMIEYKVQIGIAGTDPITFENISTRIGLQELLTEAVASVALLMNNPYETVKLESIDCDISILPKDVSARIWSVDVSDSTLRPGQNLDVTVVVESFLAQKKKYRFSLTIPDELSPGKYDLIVCGGYDYSKFLRRAMPHRFAPQNLTTLLEAMNKLLTISRDKLYCLLVLPSAGLTLAEAELPDLPATKALVLQHPKRTIQTQPYQHWLQSSRTTSVVILDKETMQITVQEQ